jgi:hypothetical protein
MCCSTGKRTLLFAKAKSKKSSESPQIIYFVWKNKEATYLQVGYTVGYQNLKAIKKGSEFLSKPLILLLVAGPGFEPGTFGL